MIKLPAYFTGFASKADGSASLRFNTQEIMPADFAVLKENHNAFGWLLFQENDISEKDIPSEDAEEEGIGASERLRRRMYVYWKSKGIETGFDTWRKQQLEKIGDALLEKLN